MTIAYGRIIPFGNNFSVALLILALSRLVSISSLCIGLAQHSKTSRGMTDKEKPTWNSAYIGYSFWVSLMREWKAEVASILKTIIPRSALSQQAGVRSQVARRPESVAHVFAVCKGGTPQNNLGNTAQTTHLGEQKPFPRHYNPPSPLAVRKPLFRR